MPLSVYGREAVLDHVFESSALTQPTIWVGLSTADPTVDGSGLAEPATEDGYSRQRPADDAGRWSRSENVVSNKGAIQFDEATGDWGTITHVALFDAETGGNMIAFAAVTTPAAVNEGNIARFAAGQLTFTLNGA